MTERSVHILAFDVPYPVSHGGFYDLYYKIIALHKLQVRIVLHCFQYGREPQKHLETFCEKVYYYKRHKSLNGFSFHLPFIVSSRRNKELIWNLAADNHPIILEGTHCTFLLYKSYFPNRRIIYRLHNIEHIYYRKLFQTERAFFKKLYYGWESRLLKKYEKKVAPAASLVLAVSPGDVKKFQKYCPKANTAYLPVFLPHVSISGLLGSGSYCLYHGNLSVAENEAACRWLMQKVFKDFSVPLVIAGRNPSSNFIQFAKPYQNVRLVANPTDEEMSNLVQQAHINLVVSMNATGIKLKLINALLYGRHCIGNSAAIEGTGLEACCTLADTPEELKSAITKLMQVPYQRFDAEKRSQIIPAQFDNEANAQKLIALLY